MTEKLRILEALKGERIKCAYVKVGFFELEWRDESNFKNREVISLPVGYTTEQYNTFLEILDKDSDFRCGEREVHGTIWLENNCWLYKASYIEEDMFHAPGEQDKEWLIRTPPPIPKQLLINQSIYDNKERELFTKMYHAVTEINDGIFEEINTRIERIAQILVDAGYSEDDIKTFVKQEIYPSYDYIIESI